jgi:monoamine oxidase
VPIGVLHEGLVRFSPQLPAAKRAAIDAIGMGPVVKVVLEFRSVFWSDGFLLTPEGSPFPTMWSRMPQLAPVLVAWAGGDAANRLIAAHADPIAAALDVCAQLFPMIDVRAQLVAAHCHDWQGDVFARGAYSYLRVNADGARRSLGEPVEDVLFFAGEATEEGDSGTVAGALDSGYRAAAQVLAVRGR